MPKKPIVKQLNGAFSTPTNKQTEDKQKGAKSSRAFKGKCKGMMMMMM